MVTVAVTKKVQALRQIFKIRTRNRSKTGFCGNKLVTPEVRRACNPESREGYEGVARGCVGGGNRDCRVIRCISGADVVRGGRSLRWIMEYVRETNI